MQTRDLGGSVGAAGAPQPPCAPCSFLLRRPTTAGARAIFKERSCKWGGHAPASGLARHRGIEVKLRQHERRLGEEGGSLTTCARAIPPLLRLAAPALQARVVWGCRGDRSYGRQARKSRLPPLPPLPPLPRPSGAPCVFAALRSLHLLPPCRVRACATTPGCTLHCSLGRSASSGASRTPRRLLAAELPGPLRDRPLSLHPSPPVQPGVWTEDEDQLLALWQSRVGNKWSEVAKHIPVRCQCASGTRGAPQSSSQNPVCLPPACPPLPRA